MSKKQRIEELERRVAELEQQVAALQASQYQRWYPWGEWRPYQPSVVTSGEITSAPLPKDWVVIS